MDYKQAFFSQLESMYLGVQIEDTQNLFNTDKIQKSGFINLLQMKSKYFGHIKNLLEKEKLNHSIYTKLYNFFSSYLNETGTPFFYDTPMHKNIYAKVYTNSKDTSLFYKTQNLYYVKSDTLYHDAEITSQDSKHTFIFDTSHFIPNADNAKNKAIFKFTIEENIRIYVLNDKESLKELPNVFKQNSSDLSDEFIKSLKDKKIQLQEEEIKKILSSYKRQNEIDFFIHKNARAFLQEQFNLWLCNYVLDDITQWRQEKIEELNILKKVAFTIIDYIADFEDELKAIWCKPKFAKKVEYVFSLDRIDSALLDSVINDEGFKAQIKEWQELRLIDESFDIKNINDEKYKFLPLDTKHFSKAIKYKILSSFEDLESTLNGELIKADNFQALNTLLPKYQNKVDLIYIDPPFNLGENASFDYKVNFKDSTWASLLDSRLELAKEFLSTKGSIFVRCDYNGNFIVRSILNNIFGEDNFVNEIIVSKSAKLTETIKKYHSGNDTLFFFSKSENYIFNVQGIERAERKWRPMHLPGERWSPIPNEYIKLFSKENLVFKNNKWTSKARIILGKEYLPPSGRHWALSQETIFDLEKKGGIKLIDGVPKTLEGSIKKLTSNWTDWVGYSSDWGFQTENHEKILGRVVLTASNQNSVVLDYHLGSGTTIATAHKLGRKWLGVEMGEHFYKVIIPRMKKVIGGFASGISKEVEFKGGGAFRYYELESYEESLANCEYVLDKDSIIDYRKSRKLIKGLKKGEAISLDMNGYREGFDILHTMANVLGLRIQRLFLDSKGIECVEFDNGDIVSSDNVDLCKYPKLTKLIWWER
ncbi:restriction endonuclease [Helicobacter pullorum]|uniref:site-specific DNA-methyltransferase n=1 Tax=Helicobacter pullorum TaxID=35818 RepID=UPI0008169F7F|nr:site-specific DNA-methyltransferase [Helicobacter pullorum]OCR19982.1 restriction endonuclease [Helicobacter pullorum]